MTESSDPPLVLIHRPPSLTFMDETLSREFRTLITDTSSESLPSFLSRHASSARAFVVVGRLPVTEELLSHLPSLQILVCTSVGIDHIDLAACKRRDLVITNAGNAFSDDVADCAVGLLLSVLRRIPAADRYVRSGNWAKFGDFQLGSKVCSKSNSQFRILIYNCSEIR